MVAVKTHQANAFLSALDRVPAAVLFYGSDSGLVSERAASLAKRLSERDTPPGEIVRFDDASLEEDPGRIFVELATVPMFCGRKIVRAIAGRRVSAQQLAPLVADALPDATRNGRNVELRHALLQPHAGRGRPVERLEAAAARSQTGSNGQHKG